MSEANSQSVKGVGKLVTTARQTRRRLNPNLEILGIVPNKVERPITNDMKSNIETLRDEYGELVFDNMLYKTVKVSEAYAKGESLADFSKAHDEKFGFADAAKELETRLEV
jgi:chromosome partitioning protein